VTPSDALWSIVAAAAQDQVLPQEPPAPLPARQPLRVIRTLAFRRRLPAAVRQAVTLAASAGLDAGDATLQTWLDDLAASRQVDLDDPEIVGGADALLAAGLVTEAQRDALLADGHPEEA
jgi:hypothetical protein